MNRIICVCSIVFTFFLFTCDVVGRFNENDPASDNYALLPEFLTASDGLSDKIRVEWKELINTEKYLVYRSDSSTDGFEQIAESKVNFYDDTKNIIDNKLYYYKVKSYFETKKTSKYSNVDSGYKSITDLATLSPPPNVIVTNGEHADKIRISWDIVNGAEKYFIYRAESSEGAYLEISNTDKLFYDDLSSDIDKRFYYKVKSWSQSKNLSVFSSYDDGYVLSTPKTILASDGEFTNNIFISWDLSNDAKKYDIHRSDSKDGIYTSLSITTEKKYSDKDVVPGVRYFYKIKSLNGEATTDFSASDSGYRKLSAPTITASNASFSNMIEVAWSNIQGATSYDVYRSLTETENFTKIGSINNSPYNDIAVEQNKVYYYKVKAYASSSESYGNESNVDSGYLLSAADGVTASDGADTGYVTISWNALSLQGASKYYIYRSESNTGTYAEIGNVPYSTLNFNDTTAISGVRYFYKVKAYNTTGQYSDFSASDSGYRKLSETVGVSATKGAHSGKITLTWNKVEGATSYDILRSQTSGGTYVKICTKTSSGNIMESVDDTYSIEERVYYYKVKAYALSSESYGAESSSFCGFITINPPSITPTEGTYQTEQNVTISSTAIGGVIRYTIDGTVPTKDSNQYTTPIVVSKFNEVNIRAKVFNSENGESFEVSKIYKIPPIYKWTK
ncbi:MAG TPA: chitobiase/beta-hexosaminidase C-terminal domain-containing protein, partial [Spirochaetota bacterium]|nr:chitobiase/beta-hexosaminidase C-terminal domain-containing protein [Spirochaetota bacterium]